MGVDINIYRASIGRFSNCLMNLVKSKKKLGKTVKLESFIWTKFLLLICLLSPAATIVQNPHKPNVNLVRISDKCISSYKTLGVNSNQARKYEFVYLDNKYSRRTNGNRNKNGIRICHYNKGNSFLQNRIFFTSKYLYLTNYI